MPGDQKSYSPSPEVNSMFKYQEIPPINLPSYDFNGLKLIIPDTSKIVKLNYSKIAQEAEVTESAVIVVLK